MAKKLLNIELKFQPGSMLCWASCILMILEKFSTTNSGSYEELINKLRFLNGADSDLDAYSTIDLQNKITNCTLISFIDSTDNNISGQWNIPIRNRGKGNFKKYFESLFSDYKIFSNEDYKIGNPILTPRTAWDLIKKQINSKSPLILIYSSDSDEEILWHAIVIVGYWQKEINNRVTENFIYVHDPLSDKPCSGETYSINVNTLWNEGTSFKPEGLIFDFKSKINISRRGEIVLLDSDSFLPDPTNIHADLSILNITS